MKSIAVLGLGLGLLVLALLPQGARAQGPDDQFISIYNLIQQADVLFDNGQAQGAREKYAEARKALERLATDYPRWNEKIVRYRMDYLTERLRATGAFVPAPTAPPTVLPPSRPVPALTPTPDARDAQINTLTEELRRLAAERDTLQAKLREALSVQPAGVDPAELARAEAQIRQLQQDRTRLEAELARQTEAATKAPDPATLETVQSSLTAARQELERQTQTVASLTQEKRDLEQRLNAALALATPPAPATPPTVAPAVTPPAVAPPAPAPAEDKSRLRQLERERDDLDKQVRRLTQELAERPARKGAPAAAQLEERVAILQARLAAYEARKVPYTPEELALFNPAASVPAPETTAAGPAQARKTGRQLPTGAVALMTEGRRAFQARRFADAEAKFQEALKLDDRNVLILTDLVAAQLEQGRLAEADTNVQRALTVNPEDAEALSLLGLLRYRQERFDEALDALSRSAKLDPNSAVTQNYLGVTLGQKGLRESAETAFRKAVQLQPAYGEAHHNLAVIYATQKPPFLELARWHYQKALAGGHPKNPEFEKMLDAGAK
ncbi:MAG: tetratricopeptide repeat protein [Verrucomicrobia bacterium]|nr:tetratricopeptide repeat protein [Verrucomicrobiota bacterium]